MEGKRLELKEDTLFNQKFLGLFEDEASYRKVKNDIDAQ